MRVLDVSVRRLGTLLALLVASTGLVATGSATAALSYSLMVSASPDRSAPVDLDSTTQTGNIYVFTSPTKDVTRVDFYIDDPGRTAAPFHTEGWAPMDLNGGSDTAANAYDTRGLPNGSHSVTAYLTLSDSTTSTLTSTFTVSNAATPPSTSVNVNFSNNTFAPPSEYVRDFGEPLGVRTGQFQGAGAYEYGWVTPGSDTPLSLVGNGRDRAYTGQPDPRLASLVHMQGGDVPGFANVTRPGAWELARPSGWYDVTLAVGDAGGATNSQHTVSVENQNAVWRFQPTSANPFQTRSVTVQVTDGYLTLTPVGGTNTKLDYVTVTPRTNTATSPYVTQTSPDNTVTSVRRDAAVSAEVRLPNSAGIDPTTITDSTVQLLDNATGAVVPSHANTTGGGDAIILQPDTLLVANTAYRFVVNGGVKDTTGAAFLPWQSVFTTGTAGAPTTGGNISFEQQPQGNGSGNLYTDVVVGPDHRLYASEIHGRIDRFPINSDGTLGVPTAITTIRDNAGPRHVIGLAFAPGSTAANPVVYATSSYDQYANAPDWSGEIVRLTGADLTTFQRVVVGLPRSSGDHETNQPVFGPDGALYWGQGSMSSMGGADPVWGNRAEHPLSAAVLRLDLSQLGTLPLNVQTADGGGTYNPQAPGAPLTVYASGLRNVFDLVFHTNGSLYAPTNGSAAGGNTPATPTPLPSSCANRIDSATNGAYTGPQVPGLTNVADAQDDFLFRVLPGGYYGHPNPARCEWVMNGGNPTSGADLDEVSQYPVGTAPDRNRRPAVFTFGQHYSPDGAIEYRSATFGGALRGQLLVTRFSAGDDIIALSVAPSGAVTDSQVGIPGLTGLSDPLAIAEDTTNGYLYVTEFGAARITLLRPLTGGTARFAVSSPDDAALGLPNPRLVFSTVGARVTPARAVTITNNGSAPLGVSNLAVSGPDASSFRLNTGQPTSLTIAPGGSAQVSLLFTPTAATGCPTTSQPLLVGNVERYAALTFSTDDPARPTGSADLAGVNACNYEGDNEPLLAQLTRALGYTTRISNGTADVRYLGPSRLQSSTDEVVAPYFTRFDPSQPVTLSPVANYGGRNTATNGFGRTGWHAKTAPVRTPCATADGCNQLFLFPGDPANGYTQNQRLMPVPNGTTTFTPSGVFGLWQGDFASINFSDDGKNVAYTTSGAEISPQHYLHDLRIYRAYGPGHVVIPHTYLVGIDITRMPANHNNDYQDVVLVLRNADPELGSAPNPGSTALSRSLTTGGTVSPACAVTGFDGVLPNTAGNQCNAANIAFTSNGLQLTSTAGQLGNNNQQNALYNLFDATRGAFTVTASVAGPVTYLLQNYQQVAAWFGPDQDNYVKVEAEHNGDGLDPHLTMYFEERGTGSTVATVSVPGLLTASRVDLVIKGNTAVPDPTPPASDPNKVRNYPLDELTVFYSLDGGSLTQIGTVRRPADVTSWFSTMAKAGILVSGGNSSQSFSSTFTAFRITSG